MAMVIYQGNNKKYRMKITLDGLPYPLLGCKIDFYVKRKPTDILSLIHKSSSIVGQIDFDEPLTLGTATLYIIPDDTLNIRIKTNYQYVIDLTTSDGEIYTICKGQFSILPS